MTETGDDRPSAFRGGERDQERPDQTGDAAPTSDVTPVDLNDVDDQPLVSSPSRTSPQDWDGEPSRRAAVSSPRRRACSGKHPEWDPVDPGAASVPNAGPAHPSKPDLRQPHVRTEP
ncbi:MAG: hypothetical protein QOE89_402 [Pseudonocardiales bacterium]|jgi:hypothetical protein|nr:hypothetical protein [Pseudonocardiales bacterium]